MAARKVILILRKTRTHAHSCIGRKEEKTETIVTLVVVKTIRPVSRFTIPRCAWDERPRGTVIVL